MCGWGSVVSMYHDRGAAFICYAHADNQSEDPKQRWLDRLLEFLQPLVRQQRLKTWSDEDIKIGGQWHELIRAQLEVSKAVVLLVSPAFLASDYIATSEIPVLLKNAVDGGLSVLPIIISPCLYDEAMFKYPDATLGPNLLKLSSLQSANPPSQTLIEMSEAEQNRVFLRVAKRLQENSVAFPRACTIGPAWGFAAVIIPAEDNNCEPRRCAATDPVHGDSLCRHWRNYHLLRV